MRKIILVMVSGLFTLAAYGQVPSQSILLDAVTGKLRPARIEPGRQTNQVQPALPIAVKTAPFISAGTLVSAEEALRAAGVKGIPVIASRALASPSFLNEELGVSPGTLGCNQRAEGRNTRVNQDCTFRRQAETKIVHNPADPANLLAGQNDSRVGFNQCGIAFSTDNGARWGDLLPPFRQKINNPAGQEPSPADPNRHTILGGPGTLHTYDFASDPAPAFDSRGRGFFSCVIADIFSNASAVFVAQSPLGAGGSFFRNIDTLSRAFMVVEDNNSQVFHDKEFIVADTYSASPNRDNVYITWTVFRFSPLCGPQPNPRAEVRFCSAPIFGSMSTDSGITWSTPEEISGASEVLCFFGNFFDPTRSPNACDFNQGSEPAVLPNGDLAVVFNNGNTAVNNPNAQQLAVHCHPTGSSPAGTARLNCGVPSKVGDDVIVGEPQCDFGRGPEECIPGAFIRTNDFPRIAVNKENGNLYVVWQDYRNGEYDIQLAVSTNGGFTWSQSETVNPDRGVDHYFPAIDLARNPTRDRVGVSYYRTERVANENTTPPGGFAPGMPGVQQGDSDYVLAGGTAMNTPYRFRVISPVFPPPDGIQAGFNGDYTGLAINQGEEAHPMWSDTRNVDPFAPMNGVLHDEDAFTATVSLPDGVGRQAVAQIGRGQSREH